MSATSSRATPSAHPSTPRSTGTTSTRTAAPPLSGPSAATLQASFAALAGSLGGSIGVAVVPIGPASWTQDATPVRFGSLRTDVAWSTAKVPLAVAALAAGSPSALADSHAAITRSDNAAAERLWSSLGGGTSAGRSVDAVLRSLGDTHTATNTVQARPGYTPFGQTRWSADDQARVAAALPCEPHARTVYALMGQVEAGQSWGLGVRSGAHFKGGWGPDQAGRYLVRQMGVIAVSGRPVLGVAILSKPASGSFDGGVRALDAVAGWLYSHLAQLPTGHC